MLFYLIHPSSWPPGLRESGVFIAREPEEVQQIFIDAGFHNVEIRSIEFQDGKGFCVRGEK